MANHQTRPGSWGKIPRAKKQPDGQYLASGRYKTLDGKLVQRMRSGTTARKAEDALLAVFQAMAAEDEARKKAAEKTRPTKIRHGAEAHCLPRSSRTGSHISNPAASDCVPVRPTSTPVWRGPTLCLLWELLHWATSTSEPAPTFCTASSTAAATTPRPNITV
jgi:hypothetical protein